MKAELFIYIAIIVGLLGTIGVLFFWALILNAVKWLYGKILHSIKYRYECMECNEKLSKDSCTQCHGLGYYTEEDTRIKCNHASTVCTKHVVERVMDENPSGWE